MAPHLRGSFIGGSGWGPAAVAIYLEYYKLVSKQGPPRTIHWFLQRAWQLQSTKPADKVYGLLGLVKDRYAIRHSGRTAQYIQQNGLVQKLDGKREIQVDYDLPFHMVFEDIARLTLEEEDSYDMLADAGNGKSGRHSHLPSWVPDWTSYPEEAALVSGFGPPSTSNYRASMGPKPVPPPKYMPRLLEVEACFADMVLIEAARYCGEIDIIEAPEDALLQHLRIINVKQHILSLWWCFGVKFNKYPTGERPFDAFWRTLIANRVVVGDRKVAPSASFAESFLMAYPEILEVGIKDEKPACICPTWAITENQKRQPEERQQDHMQDAADGKVEEKPLPMRDRYPRPGEFFGHNSPIYGEHYTEALPQAAVGRRFFRTRNGYMGIGPRNVASSDRVVIVKGTSLPFIMRKCDAGDIEAKPVFSLVGEAYVHGLSEGEALQDFRGVDTNSMWKRIILK